MNANTQSSAKYIKFLLYAIVVVLVNVAGLTLFFRADLTHNGIYSLSRISKQVVSTLTEPLTVKVFFTQDLPAPYNNTQRYLQDLLNEYAQFNKKYFRPHFYNVSPETEGISDDARANREMARDYGINPVQIQAVEKDELKFKKAYMGLVLIHGDTIERIPTITTTDGLEYKLTTAIQKLNNKVSALLALDGKVQVKLVLSSSIYNVAPYMGIKDLKSYAERLKKIVTKLNATTYDKLAFSYIDPSSDPAAAKEVQNHKLMQLNWPALPKDNVVPGKGVIGLMLQYKDKVRDIPLLHVVRLPIFGTQYQLTEPEDVEELINVNLDRLININQEIGYLADYGSLEPWSLGAMGPRNQDALSRFNALVSKSYSLKSISLKDGPVPDGLKSLLIARPTEKFSDYALYQIDQALMRGTNLAFFLDAFKETHPAGQQSFMNQMPNYVPIDSGLEKLLAHYGVRIKQSMVLDENCYHQRISPQQGGGEQPIYFAPIIQNAQIAKDLDYMKNIKGLVAVKISPLELVQKQIDNQKITAHELFASSKHSWEMRDRIILTPMFLHPPGPESEKGSLPLAYMLEGSFTSYFKGKPIPEKPADQDKQGKNGSSQKSGQPSADGDQGTPKNEELANIKAQGAMREKSPPAKIFVVASSEFLKDSLLDEEGRSTNAMFVQNILDVLNGREGIAAMRTKAQTFNPLEETSATAKATIKAVNIVGLPILVVIFGLCVWLRRHARRKSIQMLFQG